MTGPTIARGRRWVPSLPIALFIAYGLLVAAWFGASPPGAGPDEYAYSLKADAAGRGVLVGEPVQVAELAADPQLSLGLAAVPRLDQITRAIMLPANLVRPQVPCFAFQPSVSASCARSEPVLPGAQPVRVLAYMQAYPPFLFIGPGLLARAAGDRDSALMLARAGAAIVAVVMLALAIAAASYGRAGIMAFLGIGVALTPVALSAAGVLGSSGAEITSAVAAVLCILRLSRGDRPPRWVWLLLGVAGVVLAFSRTLGPVWLTLDAGLWLGMAGPRAAVSKIREGGRVAMTSVGSVAIAAAISVAWQVSVQHGPPVHFNQVLPDMVSSVGGYPTSLHELIAVLGWGETTIPDALYLAWCGAGVLLICGAVAIGTRRQRILLVGVGVMASLVVPVTIASLVAHPWQGLLYAPGRWILAAEVTVPLVAGEVLYLNRNRLSANAVRALASVVMSVIAVVQLGAWYAAERRYAVGTGGRRLFFLALDSWQPPLGWWPWLLLAAAGGGLLVLSTLLHQAPNGEQGA